MDPAPFTPAVEAEPSSRQLDQDLREWLSALRSDGAIYNRANPHSWKLGAMNAMLKEHLRLTTNEAYDQIHVQALHMADMLSSGIVKQFPRRFR
jgi:hypothetical protein